MTTKRLLTNPGSRVTVILRGKTAESSPCAHVTAADLPNFQDYQQPTKVVSCACISVAVAAPVCGDSHKRSPLWAFLSEFPRISPLHAPELSLNPTPGERNRYMENALTGNPCPDGLGLPTRAETKKTTPNTVTITLELDRSTARYLRTLARQQRRTDEMQARYMLENTVTNAYFAPAVRGTTGATR